VILDPKRTPDWLEHVLEGLRHVGFAVVTNVLEPSFIERARDAMYRVQEKISAELGEERLNRAGEIGVLRLMPKYDPYFLRFIEVPELLSVVDRTVSETAILHTQNGFILPSCSLQQTPAIFQHSFHRDFPRVFNGYLASINVMFTIDEFSAGNGGTLVVPGTHQKMSAPSQDYLKENAVAVECPPGSMFIFDSTLWHAAGANTSGKDRLAINQQFTRSYIKQQIDYVRALGDQCVLAQQPRTQQLLGWYTRVVTSLDEFYRPEQERLYRRGQG
jgi:ectoine hydroxylase-related dioxygenase (phytanoyl-CoA dioxygenase family)